MSDEPCVCDTDFTCLADVHAAAAPLTVADLTNEHHGWYIKVILQEDGPLRLPHRCFELGKGFGSGVRRWTRPDGTDVVGLCDATDARPGIVGTERVYLATTPVVLLNPPKKRRRKRSR